jgi:hypothetical protein
MPAYNTADFLRKALDGIFAQTFADFELIVIDDGSTDKTADILSHIRDSRLCVVTQDNQGLVGALTRGIGIARAPIIARHDADDASEPTRFEKQIQFLRERPDVVLLGSSMQTMDMHSTVLHNHYVLLNDPELKQELLVRSPFAHGSVMFRKDAYEKAGGYQKDDWPAEDYGLWLRMAAHGMFANLDEPLYLYRENQSGISAQNSVRQLTATKRLGEDAWKLRGYLTPKHINAEAYVGRPMDQFRLARIAQNLTHELGRALRSRDMQTAGRTLSCILSDKRLRRHFLQYIRM